jgi:hypothetical protein
MTTMLPYPYLSTPEHRYGKDPFPESTHSALEECCGEFASQTKTATTRRVHWAPEVINNENKERLLPKASYQSSKSSSARSSSSIRRLPIPVMNSSIKIVRDSIPSRIEPVDSGDTLLYPTRVSQETFRVQNEVIPRRQHRTSSSSISTLDHVTSRGSPNQSKGHRSRSSNRHLDWSNREPLANRSSRRLSPSSRHRTSSIWKDLPPVPEAPQFNPPPPTPRVRRLPTPDLDDISREAFCYCEDACYGCSGQFSPKTPWSDGGSSKVAAQSK